MVNNNDFKQFVQERNEALFSLDERKIRDYAEKYGIRMPENKKAFNAGVYKAICNITEAPEDIKIKARDWLDKNNFSEEIF